MLISGESGWIQLLIALSLSLLHRLIIFKTKSWKETTSPLPIRALKSAHICARTQGACMHTRTCILWPNRWVCKEHWAWVSRTSLWSRSVLSVSIHPFILVYFLSCKMRAENAIYTHEMQYEHLGGWSSTMKGLRTEARGLDEMVFSILRFLSKEVGVGDRNCLQGHPLPTQLPSSRPLKQP